MRKLLIDTNILVLWIVGSYDRQSIRQFRRTSIFSPNDFDLLLAFRNRFGTALTTPSILTEVSNLFGNSFHAEVAPTFVELVRLFVETAKPKDEVMAADAFDRLGFSDCSILQALDPETTLLTDDVSLYLQALNDGFEAFNFNHLREFGV